MKFSEETCVSCRHWVQLDYKHNISSVVTSSTNEVKSRTIVVAKGTKLLMRHNSFTDDIPVCIVLKAMGMETDQEIMQMVREGSCVCSIQSALWYLCLWGEVT